MIAEACMAYLDDNHRCSWKPLDPHRKDFVPDALQMAYVHMGYAPINEIVFLKMASLYVDFCHGGCEWAHDCCYSGGLTLDGCWCPWCQRPSTIDCTTTDVVLSRDVPTAVTYLHRTHPHLVPIEELAFRDLAEKVEDYQDFRGEYHHWGEEAVAAFREFSGPIMDYYHYENEIDLIEVAAFKDISSAGVGYMSYQPPPYFPKFLLLPAELRTEIYHQYLLEEFKDSKVCQHRHFDDWGNGCCVWEYPHVLVACDNHDSGFFPSPETASIPEGWLPALARTCPQLLGEVVKHMLVYTERFDLKYMRSNPQFKIATWLRKLLDAIPEGGGQYAVKYLNFPHMSLFNKSMRPLAMTNPSIELAMACRSLRKLDMTFHFRQISKYDKQLGRRVPISLGNVLHKFKLLSLLECENLRDVFLDGIHGQPSRSGQESDLATLIDLGKWLVKEYRVGHERKIKVEVGLRGDACRVGRGFGIIITLGEREKMEVARRLTIKRGQIVPTASRCAYPLFM
jgi:hypothetical protein